MIAIVIVGYNSQPYLDNCLKSIYNSTYKNFKVIFVDNLSKDSSLTFIAENFPSVVVVANVTNEGFAKANNIGIEKAKALGAKAILLLNPDTALDAHCLELLQSRSDGKTILQPAILLDPQKRTDKINTTGGVLSVLGFSYCSDYQKSISKITESSERPIASGAAMFVPTAILNKIGGFDETFFMYHEDVDLAWRARLAGYKIQLIPQAKVWHDYSFGRNASKFFNVERNRIIFLLKNFSLRYWLLLLPLFLVTELGVCLFIAKDGLLLTKLKSYVALFKLWPTILKQRAKVQKMRQVSDRQLSGLLSDRIQFSEMAIPLLVPYNMFVGLYWRLMRTLL